MLVGAKTIAKVNGCAVDVSVADAPDVVPMLDERSPLVLLIAPNPVACTGTVTVQLPPFATDPLERLTVDVPATAVSVAEVQLDVAAGV